MSIVVASVASLVGCASVEQGMMKVREALPIGGAILGGVLCYKLYEGKNQGLVTALCAAGAAWLGSRLRDYLDEKERAQLAEATYKTLDTGKAERVVSEKGTTMTAEIIKAPAAPAPQTKPSPTSAIPKASTAPQRGTAPAAPVVAQAQGAECRTVRQTIVLKSGERYQEDLTACKKDGQWVPQTTS